MNNSTYINYDDPNAARFVENIKGWVDINNRFWGNGPDSEHMARYSSCTHMKCECGKLKPKGYLKCDECRDKSDIEKYNDLPFKEYNGELVYSYKADMYFNDSDEIEEYCYDNEVESKDLLLVFCEPNKLSEIDSSYWDDFMSEYDDIDLPKELLDALDNLNNVISKLPPISYSPGYIRTLYIYQQ